MSNKNISPEERLFKLIKKQEVVSSDKPIIKKRRMKIDLKRFARFFANFKKPGLLQRETLKKTVSRTLPIKERELNLRVANKVFMVASTALLILVIYQGIGKREDMAAISGAVSKIKFQPIRSAEIKAFKSADYYLGEINKRNIFKPLPRVKKRTSAFNPDIKKTREKLEEIIKDLKLVGIAWGESSRALIKSQKAQNTYFLKQGQMIGATGVKVMTILRRKVLVSYQGEEMELM